MEILQNGNANAIKLNNLHPDCSELTIRMSVDNSLQLMDVYIPRSKFTGQSRGFGFVRVAGIKMANAVILCLNDKLVCGFLYVTYIRMSLSDEKCLSFLAEWTDPQSSLVHEFRLRYFISTSEVDLLNIKTKKIFLKKSSVPEINVSSISIGSKLTIFSRTLTIKKYLDQETRDTVQDEEYTCAIIKPNGYNKIGSIMSIIEERLRITKLKMIKLSKKRAEDFYSEYSGENFFSTLTNLMASDVIVVMQLTGVDAIRVCLELVDDASVHASDSKASADRDLAFFFSNEVLTTAVHTNCTLCVVKPHAVRSAGKIVEQILGERLEISAMDLRHIDVVIAEEFMEVYRGVLPDFGALCAELASGPALVMEVRSENVVEKLRALVGPSDPDLARQVRPQTMRAKFGIDRVQNAVHCTDLPEDGILESKYFF